MITPTCTLTRYRDVGAFGKSSVDLELRSVWPSIQYKGLSTWARYLCMHGHIGGFAKGADFRQLAAAIAPADAGLVARRTAANESAVAGHLPAAARIVPHTPAIHVCTS